MGSPTPSFADGQAPIGTATYNAAVAGNAAPFNGYIGSDITGPNFSASWSYSYAPILDTIASATLTLGLYDADSSASGSQVASFRLSGTNLTASFNASLDSLHGGTGSVSGEYDIVTITLLASTFTALAGGSPALTFKFAGARLGSTWRDSFQRGRAGFFHPDD